MKSAAKTVPITAVFFLAVAADPHKTPALELSVESVEPPARSMETPIDAVITVHFDRPVARETVTPSSFSAFGRWSGAATGTYSFADGDQTVTLTPDQPFSAGETVMVVLSHDLQAADGLFLRTAGFSYQFWTAARPAVMVFEQIDSMTTRTDPKISSRAYGGIASDLNRDGWLDLTVVNEDTADLRVFMNRADGTGLFDDFIQPTFPVGDRASPSEPADFNGDGFVDICVANINDNSVSVLLGNGDGLFRPQQQITVGSVPRGIAVLDVDGDGDLDIGNTNAVSDNVSILLNNGSGIFGAPTYFEGGGVTEWALAAADMNEDGILDLVIGARGSQAIVVQTGNGDGTFSIASSQNSGGSVWMLVCGDVNADGHEDVATANSSSDNGSILLGDGNGNVAPPVTTATDSFPLATDLGDLDGDGDLDWVTSSFGGDWFLFTNDGSGSFTFDRELAAPQAASCSLMLDFDNDRDLDLVLIDELEDVVVLMKNSGTSVLPGDLDGDGDVDLTDYAIFSGCLNGPGVSVPPLDCHAADFANSDLDFDEDVDLYDAAEFTMSFDA